MSTVATVMKEVERKLAAARTQLILEKPFLGALVLRLPLREAYGDWCTSSATDARSIYYCAEYIDSLSLSQVQFVLAHEALHCGLCHFARRDYRDIHRWNIACDHAVNPLLVEDRLELPPGALYNEEYTGLSAEEIYPLIKKDTSEETLDQHMYDSPDRDSGGDSIDHQSRDHSQRGQPPESADNSQSGQKQKPQPDQSDARAPGHSHVSDTDHGSLSSVTEQAQVREQQSHQLTGALPNSMAGGSSDSQPPAPLSAQDKAQLSVQWQQRLAGAAQQAFQAGKINGSVARLIERLLRSSVPWRTLLARFMSGSSRVDYNIMRPSQRRSGDAILPSLHVRQANIVIALDTSGSIVQQELTEFVAEVNALKSLVNTRITLLACDWQLDEDGPWVFEPWDHLALPKTFQGGGGTDFSPVFDWMQSNPSHVDLVIYFTDAQGKFPSKPPSTETLWLVKGSGDVPWGQRIQLN